MKTDINLDRDSVPSPIAIDILMDAMASYTCSLSLAIVSISISIAIGDGTETRSNINQITYHITMPFHDL